MDIEYTWILRQWKGWDIGLFITLSPKFYNNILLFVALAAQHWGLLLNFDWLVSTTYYNLQRDNFVHHHWGCK